MVPGGIALQTGRGFTLMASGMSRTPGKRALVRHKSASKDAKLPTPEEGLPRPGDVLRQSVLKRFGITQDELAIAMRTTRYSVNQLVNHQRAVTPEMALRLSRVTNTSAQFWLQLQQRVDLEKARATLARELSLIQPLRSGSE